MGISPFPGKEIGLFTFTHVLSILDTHIAFFHNAKGQVAIIPIEADDVSYFVAGQTYDLGVVVP